MKRTLILTIITVIVLIMFPGLKDAGVIEKNFPIRDSLISGTDSLVIDTCGTQYQYIYVTIKDTGVAVASGGIQDSVLVETYNPKLAEWVRVGVRNTLTYTDTEVAVPGSGNTRMFLVLATGIDKIRYRKGNVTYTAGVLTIPQTYGIGYY
jgi:hypothetical protein